jgi:hypothetical protein
MAQRRRTVDARRRIVRAGDADDREQRQNHDDRTATPHRFTPTAPK